MNDKSNLTSFSCAYHIAKTCVLEMTLSLLIFFIVIILDRSYFRVWFLCIYIHHFDGNVHFLFSFNSIVLEKGGSQLEK